MQVWKTPNWLLCWSVAVLPAIQLLGKRSCSATIGVSITFVIGLQVRPTTLKTLRRRSSSKCTGTLKSYDVERGAFMTWVTTITRNLLVDHFRKTKQERMTDSLDSAPSEHEDAMP